MNKLLKIGLISSAIFLSLFIIFQGYSKLSINSNGKNEIIIGIDYLPYSSDPLDYDDFIHHLAFTSVYANLVSNYNRKGITADLATSWISENDFKTWKFKIDTSRTFSDGSPIDLKVIVTSLKRIFFLMHTKNSKSGISENLVGIEKLRSPINDFEGLLANNENEITFHLKKSDSNFIAKLSFGLYGIVSPNSFNPNTGEWLDKSKVLPSGNYKVLRWDKDSFVLNLREENVKYLQIKSPIKQILFKLTSSENSNSMFDIVHSSSDSISFSNEFQFYGPVQQNNRYVVCGSWNLKNSLCSSKKFRKDLRSVFYNFAESNKVKTSKSFFSTIIPGVKEAIDISKTDFPELPINTDTHVWFQKTRITKKDKEKSHLNDFNDFYFSFLNATSEKYKLEVKNDEWQKLRKERTLFYPYDLTYSITGLLLDSPYDDIRFMFLSKDGANLPDEDGSITVELNKDNFDIQKVNELIWEQAIIWPVNHFAFGVWAKKESNLNFDQINLSLPPIDFNFLEKK